jgi:hypothetical protein
MTLTRDWLLAHLDTQPIDLAKQLGLGEKDVMRAYWRECRAVGAPVPVISPVAKCEKCACRRLCTLDWCACESVQAWEVDQIPRIA